MTRAPTATAGMHARVAAYLAFRRQAGLALTIEAGQLASFARFAEACGHQGPLTLDLAIRWATATTRAAARGGRPSTGSLTAARRLEVLRGFARYCAEEEPTTVIPPRDLFGPAHRRLPPHIYTEPEICALLDAAAALRPAEGLRPASCVALFGLLAATGLRISEATGLTRADVDLVAGQLHLRRAKFGKARWVPLHPTTTRALQRYAERRDRAPASALSAAFFVFDDGRPATPARVQYAFRQLRQTLGWRARGGHPAPRLHDLRHTLVCRRLERWYAAGLDVDREIVALATYLGHTHVTATYWYLTATPALLAHAARRGERDPADRHSMGGDK